MCGVSAVLGGSEGAARSAVDAMVAAQSHRGPDDRGVWVDPDGRAMLGHNRLSILDLSDAGHQPATSVDGRHVIVFNGELYNYRELRSELEPYPFRSSGDTEIVLASWGRWGEACLDRFLGMFAFVVWDRETGTATIVRDRFGVKPLYLAPLPGGGVGVASEIKALHAAGVPRRPDRSTWATFLATGRHELSDRTFWEGVKPVPAGSLVRYDAGAVARPHRWYDVAARVGELDDDRSDDAVADEWLALALDAVALRFRSDVPVGINLSGGVDSSFLLAAVDAVNPDAGSVTAYTFVTGDPRYDELSWVDELLDGTHHPSCVVTLTPSDVPDLAIAVAKHQDEPFGGVPTLAYARLFESAHAAGTSVLLDGQGLDEQWAGYDYYRRTLDCAMVPVVQGGTDSPVRPECLNSDAGTLVLAAGEPVAGAGLRALQVRDLTVTKIPRALRYNDRVSMRSSCELREPFLDHRLVELALRQPVGRKVSATTGKVFLRRILGDRLPAKVVEAPKRPLQTPQREWLRGPLAGWAEDRIEAGLAELGGELLDAGAVRTQWRRFRDGHGDNSYFVWQWVSLGLLAGSGGG